MTNQQTLIVAAILWLLVAGWGGALAGTTLGGELR